MSKSDGNIENDHFALESHVYVIRISKMWKIRKLIVQSVINSLTVDRKINFMEMQIFRCTLRCVEIFAFFSPLEKKS